ncbi:hypothetical protein DSO57_1009759 [Entomophthora muscae]|uniref:Uncharacterized protein n=1 Tax=Entomophthora muscae TaxID=34485 RepID=A0ACC2RLJ2_9FUNG|nr:hypothetical protein DSO57_1009759 [Entomophthora muscae]
MESINCSPETALQMAPHALVQGLVAKVGLKPKTVRFSRFCVEFTTFCSNEYDRTPFLSAAATSLRRRKQDKPAIAEPTLTSPDDTTLV